MIQVAAGSGNCFASFVLYTDSNHRTVTNVRPVLIVYAHDNYAHCEVVWRFAVYLESQCHCDVKLDIWSKDDISHTSAFDWTTRQLRSADDVIIVHSEAGFRQHEAWSGGGGGGYEAVDDRMPLADTFLAAVLEVKRYYLERNDKRFYNVVFPYTDASRFIVDTRLGITYRMMSDLEELFLNVHEMTKFNRCGVTTAPRINAAEYAGCEPGRRLCDAISKATAFVDVHPDWFNRRYRRKGVRPKNGAAIDLQICSTAIDSRSKQATNDRSDSTAVDSGIQSAYVSYDAASTANPISYVRPNRQRLPCDGRIESSACVESGIVSSSFPDATSYASREPLLVQTEAVAAVVGRFDASKPVAVESAEDENRNLVSPVRSSEFLCNGERVKTTATTCGSDDVQYQLFNIEWISPDPCDDDVVTLSGSSEDRINYQFSLFNAEFDDDLIASGEILAMTNC